MMATATEELQIEHKLRPVGDRVKFTAICEDVAVSWWYDKAEIKSAAQKKAAWHDVDNRLRLKLGLDPVESAA